MKKSTAINRYNVASTFNSGKVGNVRFYRKGDKSFVRSAYNSSINNPRTMAQMNRRLKWASTSLIWKRLRNYLEKSFEGVTPTVSTCNLFMKANGKLPLGVYLPKDSKSEFLRPYVVSNGQLASISDCYAGFEAEEEGETSRCDMMSNLNLPNGTYNTVSEISTALLSNNTNLQEGDQITLIKILRDTRIPIGTPMSETNFQRLNVSAIKLVLRSDDNTPLTTGFISQYNKLAVNLSMTSAGPGYHSFAFIHSRVEGGKLLVSKETLVLSTSMLFVSGDMLSDAQYQRAAASYGDESQLYLQPSTFKSKIEVYYSTTNDAYYTGSVHREPEIYHDATDLVSGSGEYEVGSPVTLTPNFGVGVTITYCVNHDTGEELTQTPGSPVTFNAPVNGMKVIYAINSL